nr:ankyrin repeat domain-containing protein 26 [Marmota flaviventris]
MKRIFGFGSKGRSPLGSSSNLRRNCVGFGLENASSLNSPRYHIRDKDTGKIHKAASMGNVAKVQHLLILGENGVNDKDKKNRTALHFACAYGHPEVVTLLVERKCNIDICDSDGSTALIKAVQCQEEECATILLEHGADPNVKDSSGNTALHYAVYIENTSIAVKLLLHNANTEAKNKDGHTPLLLALRENKQQMAEVLVNKKANIHAVDELERQVIFEYDEKRLKHSQINNSVLEIEPRASASCILVDESSEDESLTRLSNKPGPGDPWPTSDEEDSNFDTKNFPKVNLTELWTTTQQFKKNRAKYDILKPENRTLFDSSDSDSQNEDMDETLPKTSVKQSFSGPSILSSDPNEGATKPIIGKEENGTKSASQDQTNNGNLTYVDAGHKKSKSDLMSALGLGEEEEEESPWDSESISERLPQKGVSHLSGAVHERGNNINGQVEDMIYIPSCMSGSRNLKMAKLEKTRNVGIPVANMESPEKYPQLKTTSEMKDSLLSKAIGMKDVQTFKSEPNLEVTSEEEQKRLDGSENNQSQNFLLQVEEKRKEHKGNEMEVSETLSDGFAATDNDDGLIQQRKNEKTDNQKFPIEENKKHEGDDRNDLQRQLTQEQNARILQDGILANHLCKQKEIEMAQMKMSSEVSISHEKEKNLLHKSHSLQKEISMIRLEIDTIKNQNQEKEKKYLEDVEIANEKNDNLQKTIKLNEETFTTTVLQYNGQLSILTAQNTMLNSKLENEKQNKERLEIEVESYRSRLAAAIHDYDESQASKRDLELAFQRSRDECFRLQDKMNFSISNLKDNNEILSQQLSKAERKFNSLEIELHHTKDALREKTLVLEQVQRDLNQTQGQMKEIECMYQNEQCKVNKYVGKQESLEERLSQLQSENTLLRQQLDDAQNKADNKEKTVINIQDQFHDIVKKLQAESKKQNLMLEDRNKELINECNHLKERLYQYENEKAEREAVVRQLQQELADTLKKQSMSEASLEVSSRYRISLEDETQDLKKKLAQIRSQLQEAEDQHTEAAQCVEKMQDHLQKLEIQNSKLKDTIKKQTGKIEQLQKNLLSANLSEDDKEQLKKLTELKQSLEYTLDQEKKKNGKLEKELTGFKKLLKMTKTKLNKYENGEFSFHEDLKNSSFEMDIPINMLIYKIDDLAAKLETASSKCLHLDKKNQFLHQELLSMKTMQKKCEKLEKNKKKLEQEVVNLKSHIEKKNMEEHGQLEQYKQEIEDRARQDLVEKLKQVNLFLKTQAASQENLEQLRESNNASIRSQMELRIKDLEYELSKIKTQEDSNKIELEKYKQLYVEEFKIRKSLLNKLNKANEKLEDVNTQLLVEKQNRSLLSTVSPRPVVECSCVGSLNNSLVLNRSYFPRENLVVPTSNPKPSNKSMENYLAEMQQKLEKSITRELKEVADELESGSLRASPLGSTHKSSQDLLSEASQEYVEILKKKYMI